MIGMGDVYTRRIDAEEEREMRTTYECHHCGERYPRDENHGATRLCPECYSRLHPICACGCGKPARIVADVRWAGGVDCRAPWVDMEHALGSVAEHTTDRPSIDVILDAQALPAVLGLVASEMSPCWCDMEKMKCFHGIEYHTQLPWCPRHGI